MRGGKKKEQKKLISVLLIKLNQPIRIGNKINKRFAGWKWLLWHVYEGLI